MSQRRVNQLESEYMGPNKYGRSRWAFDGVYLLKTVGIFAVIGLLLFGLYTYQSSRISGELLRRAAEAEANKDYKKQAAWLQRAIGLDPQDKKSTIALGLAVDNSVETADDLIKARRRLSAAIASTGESPEFAEARKDLRRRLIRRLIQLAKIAPGEFANDAEQQILLLDPPADDPLATQWFAESLVVQVLSGQDRKPPTSKIPKSQHWKWLGTQPLGHVIHRAFMLRPDDPDVAGMYITSIMDHAEWFELADDDGVRLARENLLEDARKALPRFREQRENGRMQVLAVAYAESLERSLVSTILKESYAGAMARLKENLKTTKQDNWGGRYDESYNPSADWSLVIDYARNAQQDADANLEDLYVELLALKQSLPRQQLEGLYIDAGQYYWQKGQQPKAIELWQAGLKSVDSSIALANKLLLAWIQIGETEQAEKILADVERLLTNSVAELSGPKSAGMSAARKEQLRKQLELARWENSYLKGQLFFSKGKVAEAITYLQRAFESPIVVTDVQRVAVGQTLANCYGAIGQWDLAGQVLDACVALRPDDKRIKRASVDAWRRLGANSQGVPLEAIDDGSFAAALEMVQITLAAAQTGNTKIETVKRAFADARRKWEQMSDEEKKQQPIWRLELLETAILPPEQRGLRLAEIAKQYSTDIELQVLVGYSLAQQRMTAEANDCLGRARSIAQATNREVDKVTAATCAAYILEASGKYTEALAELQNAIKNLPSSALTIAKAGARIAVRNKAMGQARDFLVNLNESLLDFESLMLLASIAETNGDTEDFKRWEGALRRLEGDQGSTWRYLAAIGALKEADQKQPGTIARKQLVSRAESYYGEIARARPRWGQASSLGARIAAENGLLQEAVDLYRRAIRDGDARPAVKIELIKSLIATNRFDEAERESRDLLTLGEYQTPVNLLQIDMAREKGEYRKALEIARQVVNSNPSDVNSLLVAYQSAMASASVKTLTDSERDAFVAEAERYLDQAHTVSAGKDLRVWATRLRFLLALRKTEEAKALLRELKSAPIPDVERLVQCGKGYLQMGDLAAAQECVRQALAVNPSHVQAHMLLATLLDKLGDSAGAIKSLEAAHQLDKDNADIREQLALKKSLSGVEVPWDEIDELIGDRVAASNPRMRLVRAFIGLRKGDESKKELALTTLSEMANGKDVSAPIAKRLLAQHYGIAWANLSETARQQPSGQRLYQQARGLYEELVAQYQSQNDLVNFINLLILAKEEKEVSRQLTALEAMGPTVNALELRIRLAQMSADKELNVDEIAKQWLQDAKLSQDFAFLLAGKTLGEMKFGEKSVQYLEQAYKLNPNTYEFLVQALVRDNQFERALQVCEERAAELGTPDPVQVLAILSSRHLGYFDEERSEKLFKGALAKFPNDIVLWEAIATLRLYQERFAEAVVLFEHADALAPNQPQLLNNLALCLCELPTRGNDALARIEKAIQIYQQRAPELLDTLAVVHAKMGNFPIAIKTLQEAMAKSDNPRLRMRMADIQLRSKDREGALKTWNTTNVAQLEKMSLDAIESKVLLKLKAEFGEQKR